MTDANVSRRAEWKSRLMRAVLHREFDDEVIADMLVTGLYEAHSEGLQDAANICRKTGNIQLADAIMLLDRLNKRDDGQSVKE